MILNEFALIRVTKLKGFDKKKLKSYLYNNYSGFVSVTWTGDLSLLLPSYTLAPARFFPARIREKQKKIMPNWAEN